ncbi:flavin reductase [Amycolatopsis azurea]|uniref:4-hydroxyphenylacetate 3-monooxygenase reductase subunit n=1 Tax=Amycolatopsis azurea DSM 43854 TaxID=1238180 RepID=M2QEQ4_9PSEU|nr:flavin reductase [Amycolatopsis azurea]EMD24512.1 4-hydroxyphenylacetate 3-monooxygenase, reductase component [Amycolatopsis azurea DSM 43854]OOC01104.1 4-hydroxyphenylacetate 3-monooxygenase reductase subunit [Amycolatopsis azurea DSM 43854]
MTDELTTTQRRFRAAMANLSTAVNIVTTDGVSGKAGITVSAVCSVTDSPPTLLVCVNQSSYTHDIFRTNRRMAINVLAPQHENLAVQFAGATDVPMLDRFRFDVWDHDSFGIPVVRDAAAVLIGQVGAEFTQGTHTVLFVEVEDVFVDEDAGALAYFRRAFHRIAPTGANA